MTTAQFWRRNKHGHDSHSQCCRMSPWMEVWWLACPRLNRLDAHSSKKICSLRETERKCEMCTVQVWFSCRAETGETDGPCVPWIALARHHDHTVMANTEGRLCESAIHAKRPSAVLQRSFGSLEGTQAWRFHGHTIHCASCSIIDALSAKRTVTPRRVAKAGREETHDR